MARRALLWGSRYVQCSQAKSRPRLLPRRVPKPGHERSSEYRATRDRLPVFVLGPIVG
jgi:hypothetical protein